MSRILSSPMMSALSLTTVLLLSLILPLGKVHAAVGTSDKFYAAEGSTRQDQAAGNASAKVQAAEGTAEGDHLASKTPSQGQTHYGKHFGASARVRNAQRLSNRLCK